MSAFLRRVKLTRPLRAVHLCDADTASGAAGEATTDHDPQRAAREAERLAEAEREARRLAEQQRLVELREISSAIHEQLAELESRRQNSLDELQQLALELAMEASSHIVRRTVSRDEFPIQELIAEAVSRLDAARSITIRLHPGDLQQLEQLLKESDSTSLPEKVRLIAEPTLARGSCAADGGDYGLLATWHEQLVEMQRLLREGLDDAQIERRGTEAASAGMRRFPDRRETA